MYLNIIIFVLLIIILLTFGRNIDDEDYFYPDQVTLPQAEFDCQGFFINIFGCVMN